MGRKPCCPAGYSASSTTFTAVAARFATSNCSVLISKPFNSTGTAHSPSVSTVFRFWSVGLNSRTMRPSPTSAGLIAETCTTSSESVTPPLTWGPWPEGKNETIIGFSLCASASRSTVAKRAADGPALNQKRKSRSPWSMRGRNLPSGSSGRPTFKAEYAGERRATNSSVLLAAS